MSLQNPVVAYEARDNAQANLLRLRLIAEDVTAFVEEDHSGVGDSLWGQSSLNKPKVWVEKTNLEQALAVLKQFERELVQKSQRVEDSVNTWKMIDAVCETCGTTQQFAEEMKGSVQDCPQCGDFLDVGNVDWDEQDYAGESYPD